MLVALDDSDDELELEIQNLNIFKKMGKGLKSFEKKAKKARDMGKKYYPMADQAFAIVAP